MKPKPKKPLYVGRSYRGYEISNRRPPGEEDMSKNDGGPAFPLTGDAISHENRDFYMQGMSLRDYFAAAALQGMLIANPLYKVPQGNVSNTPIYVAASAYEIADAMLEARTK